MSGNSCQTLELPSSLPGLPGAEEKNWLRGRGDEWSPEAAEVGLLGELTRGPVPGPCT